MRRLLMCIWVGLCTFAIQAEEITTWQLMAHSSQNPLPDGTYAIVTAQEYGYKALTELDEYYGKITSDGFVFGSDSVADSTPSGLFFTFTLKNISTTGLYTIQNTANNLYLAASTYLVWSSTANENQQEYWVESGDYIKWKTSSGTKLVSANNAIQTLTGTSTTNKPVSFVRKTQAYQRALGTVKMGTICVPCDVRAEDIQGCTCFEVLGTTGTGDNQVIHLGSVDSMKAGLPYIYVGDEDANQVKWTYSGQAVSSPGNKNGLYGTFEDISSSTNFLTGKYLLTVDSIGRVVFGLCADGSSLSANKAYLILDKVTQLSTAPSAPGRQLLSIGSPNMGPTTMLDECRRVECCKVEKMWIRGQWMIRRGNKMYTLYGQPITGE